MNNDNLSDIQGKILKAFRKNNFLAFAKYYLPHLFPLPFSKFSIHNDFAEAIEAARFAPVFEGFLAPRDVAKTTFFAIAAPIYWICHDRREKIHIVQKTGDVGSVIRQIMHELETNEKILRDFGSFRPKDRQLKWSYEEGGIVEGAEDKKNLSISGCGVRGSNIGKRTTKIIIDDPHDIENVATLYRRDKTISWIMEAILPTLSPRGSFIVINSSYHEDDFLNRYRRKGISLTWANPDGSISTRAFRIRVYDSIIDDNTQQTIWPEKNSYQQLMFRKKLMGTEAFNRQYRNIITSDETASFRRSDLDAMLDYTLSYVDSVQDREQFRAIVQTYDLAVIEDVAKAEEQDSDYYVGYTIGITQDNKRQVLNIWRARGLKSHEVLAHIESSYQKFHPDLIVVESNQFQRWFADFLLRFRNLPIYKSITIGNDRAMLAAKSSVLHIAIENHLWRLPYRTDHDRELSELVCHELHAFGKERHDDLVIGMYLLEKTLGDVQRIVAEQLIKEDGEVSTIMIPDTELRVNL